MVAAGRVRIRDGAVLVGVGPTWPVTIWVHGGSNTHPTPAFTGPYISKVVSSMEGWGHVGVNRGGYSSLEIAAEDAAGVVWAAGSVRSTVGSPPAYHWQDDARGYALGLKPGWIPWAYYTMLPGWVLQRDYNSGGLRFPYPGYRVERRGDFYVFAP